MGLGRPRAQVAASVAVFGLVFALGASRAQAGGSANATALSPYASLCKVTHLCGAPKRYRFRVSGTTNLYLGGTETYVAEGTLRRTKYKAGAKAEYRQTEGTVTTTWTNVGIDLVLHPECDAGDTPGLAIGNSPTQTRPLIGSDYEIYFIFSKGRYEIDPFNPTGGDPPVGPQGTGTCPNGAMFSVVFGHRSPNTIERKGRPRRVVTGSAEYTDVEIYHYRYSWRLTAIK